MPRFDGQLLAIAPDILFQHLDDEAVLLQLESETYFGLNPMGTRVWHLIEELADPAHVRRRLLAEYEVSEPELADDLDRLLAELLEAGLLVRREE